MATRIKPRSEPLYEQDFYAWSKAQADLLRAGRFTDLDLEHLIEEVDDLGESLYRSARSRIRTIVEHLLKLEHSAARDPRAGGRSTVLTQRDDLRDDLTPTLRRRAADDLPELFRQARKRASPIAPGPRRTCRGRCAAPDLPLYPRPDQRRVAALALGRC